MKKKSGQFGVPSLVMGSIFAALLTGGAVLQYHQYQSAKSLGSGETLLQEVDEYESIAQGTPSPLNHEESDGWAVSQTASDELADQSVFGFATALRSEKDDSTDNQASSAPAQDSESSLAAVDPLDSSPFSVFPVEATQAVIRPVVSMNSEQKLLLAEKQSLVKALPPEVEVVDGSPKSVSSSSEQATDPSATAGASAGTAESSEKLPTQKYIPFTFLYQKSFCRCVPDRIIYSFPTNMKPIEIPVVQPRPIHTQPVQTQPVQTQPIQMEPVQTQPIDEKAQQEQANTAQQKMVPVIFGPLPMAYPVYPRSLYTVYTVPYYTMPYMAPSVFGMPKMVYPNGMVVKPKVYMPGQPLKNTIRAITP